MQNDVTGTPPPPPQPATFEQEPIQEQIANGDIQNGAADSFTETVLDLLAGVLALV